MNSQNNNQPTYDISKSNFFANIEPKNNVNQPTYTISGQLNLPQVSYPPQMNNQFYYYPQIQNNFPPQMQPNQNINFQPNQNTEQTFFQKVSSTAKGAIGLIKKEDPLSQLGEIRTEEYDDIIKKASKIIQCQTIDKNKLNDNTIKALISNPRKVNDSIVKTSYSLYDISTPQFNWLVSRRYSDFLWLRDCLRFLFPVELIPQLPGKKLGGRRFEDDFIEKRTKGLQKFLDDILCNENLKSAEPLITFLSCSERNYFDQQMKLVTPKLLANESIMAIKAMNGKITVADFSTELYNGSPFYLSNISKYLNVQVDTIKNMKENLNNFNVNMVEAAKNLEEIEKGFTKLLDYSNKVNISKDISGVYEQYFIFFKNWKRSQINQASVIRENINDFFKTIKNKTKSFLELIEKEETLQKEYQGIKNTLMNKKEGLWKQMDISKWDLNPMEQIDSSLLFRDKIYAQSKMCFKETTNLNIKGDLLGYYFYSIHNNFKGLIKYFNKVYVQSLEEFSKLIEPSISDLINVWSSLSSSVSN